MEENDDRGGKRESGARIVASAILGFDFRRIIVDDKTYTIKPPTIHNLVAATYWLTGVPDAQTIRESLLTLNSLDSVCKALSCLIQGDEGLWEQLSKGTLDEVVDGLVTGFDLIDMRNFLKLSALMRSAGRLIARPK